MLHVNPHLKTKGLLMLYNPMKQKITRTIKIPLYYAGLTATASLREKGDLARVYQLDRDYSISYTCTLQPESYSWVTIE
jgi:hypothetical protein